MSLGPGLPEHACVHVGVQDTPAHKVSTAFLHVLPEVRKAGITLSNGGMPSTALGSLIGVDQDGVPSKNPLHTLVRELEDAVQSSDFLGKGFTKQYPRDPIFMHWTIKESALQKFFQVCQGISLW
jgi:hypothetical protein